MDETKPAEVPVRVVVTPIPAAESRTLKNIKWGAWVAGIAAVLPTIISIAMEMAGDPGVAALWANYVPAEARTVIAVLAGIYLRGQWKTRMDTSQPIIGSTGEAKAKGAS